MKGTTMRIIRSVTILFVIAVSASAAVPVAGNWEGMIKVQNQELRLVLHVREAEGKLTATFDSPDQYVAGMPVDNIEFKGQQLNFEIKRLMALYSGTLDKEGKAVNGAWSQLGMSFPVNFKKAAAKK
jgi:uncharacterized protein